ncbi:hypothetical protein B0A55_10029 [Friedmanniomyces simplex]|uniref:Uncharacterized protein n=1 Tax=Friedmanniomyces simplex TaxID=329884 RepID=A0A4U0WXV9_9PEZI|nr:hypothetical protein B0A55_10029 [Friedmanniomyces simplex]
MAKRKASTSTLASEKTAHADAPTPMDKAALEATLKEHREYLLANAGATAEDTMLPPAKKRKTTPKKAATVKQEVADVDEAAAAKTTESRPAGTPRNVATSKKQKAAVKKPKASVTLPTPELSDSPGSHKSSESKLDSNLADSSLPKAQEAKATPTRKRKLKAPVESEDVTEDAVEASPPKKKRTHTTSKRASPKFSNATEPPAETQPHPPPPARLTPLLAAKLRRVHFFITNTPDTTTTLTRDPSNPALISLPELELTGALIRLRADYELGDRHEAHLADIESCIVARYSAPVLQLADQAWLTIDIATEPSEFEREIQGKVAGHGLEGVNLLEVELEMQSQQVRETLGLQREGTPSASVPSAPEELRSFWERTWEGMLEGEKQRAREAAEQDMGSVASRVARGLGSGGFEAKHRGVCPAPPVEVV